MKPTAKRKLKVYYGHHGNSYKRHPVIHLGGSYLIQLGFAIGDVIEVSGENGMITISRVIAQYPGEADRGSAGAHLRKE